MEKFNEVLIDGDLLIFAVCAACEYGHEPEDVNIDEVYQSIEDKVSNIKRDLNVDKARIFLSEGNFRNYIRYDYKENRKDAWRPECLKDAHEYAKLWMNAEYVQGLEADDLLVMNQGEGKVVASIDKDIPQREGWYYKWATPYQDAELFEVKGLGTLDYNKKVRGTGFKFFCAQLLTGDPTDGIMGCGARERAVYNSGAKKGQEYVKRKGVGGKAAVELLKGIQSEREGLGIVYWQYVERFGKQDALSKMVEQGRLLYMIRETRVDDLGQMEALLWHPNPKVKEWINLQTGEINED